MTGFILHALSVEGPREVVIGFTCGAGVTLVLSWLGRRHIARHVKHARMLIEEIHHLAHTGGPHPRVQRRLRHGERHTPNLEGR